MMVPRLKTPRRIVLSTPDKTVEDIVDQLWKRKQRNKDQLEPTDFPCPAE